ncbi:hypothetical protein Glove_433g27 [Diversispora epigaea]|uniref:Uncharacterized protein n=1 Tax=Diversispora epigaea TaxID=1348612 RepID=A0A397GXW2_9GLOM|nr:hypothetical protein Glove_433g27 [Diversispora epigaea]
MECETKETQIWRYANGKKAIGQLSLYYNFFSELVSLQKSLELYSLCEKHYNQIVSKNKFYKYLSNPEEFQHSIQTFNNKKKKIRHSIDNSQLELNSLISNTQDIGIQTDESFLFQIFEKEKMEACILDLNLLIKKLQQDIRNQQFELLEISEKLSNAYNYINEIQNLYQEQRVKMEILKNQWDTRYSNQQKRINAIIEIALIELLVKFIETLTCNDWDNLIYEKIFKRAVAVDAIYGSRHRKYISEINLLASAIKYSLARSKTIINIDNHITSAGSYTRFLKWLEELPKEQELLPEGLLFLAFDNEQKGQKNYLDRGFNTVVFHTVTSFVAFDMDSQNKIQHTNNPWLHNSLTKSQYENLFNLTPEMQQELNCELYNYLNEIIDQLCNEKVTTINNVDSIIESMSSNNSQSKYCSNCKERNIDNRKQTCPKCRFKLPTLSELQNQNPIKENNNLLNIITKPYIFRSHDFKNEIKSVSVPRISITQRSIVDKGVRVPEIFIPDPLNVNPNSIANVEKVLQHIEKISGVENGIRKWMAVTCDGVPYHYAIKFKEKFPWLILIPGQLHEEMNMLKAYVELNW